MERNIKYISLIFSITIVLFYFKNCNADNSVNHLWINAFDEISNKYNTITENLITEFNRIIKYENITTQCEQRIRELIKGFNHSEWSIKSMKINHSTIIIIIKLARLIVI